MDSEHLRQLRAEHRAEAVRQRLRRHHGVSYVGDAVLGAIDGAVTTFAVAAGAVGADLAGSIVLVMGFANLFADGFSMAVSNFLRARSDQEIVERARQTEEMHVNEVPEGERTEIREIFAAKGLEGDTLNSVVKSITSNRQLWIDTMLKEELGLQVEGPSPVMSASATFSAFTAAGLIPLIPFIFSMDRAVQFSISAVATGITFFGIGLLKGLVLKRPVVRSGLISFVTGGGAAAIAYCVGVLFRVFSDGAMAFGGF